MRGLQARTELATAKVQAAIFGQDSEQAGLAALDATISATSDGIADFHHDCHTPPRFFVDEPALLEAWQDGWGFAADRHEMSHCSHCTDGTGNPCPLHG
jgi:hypothetical protein